ncbi:DM13 domain-containing protein [Streptomyces sp. NPDC006610]|jgi:hypothetical protein|uniref:DM13 domain-containing protein n=1 Tax=Streptomyces sp. NPDC006610 TaxID=3154584 RepID=UPI0033AD36C2
MRRVYVGLGAAVVLAGAGLYWFKPWTLWVDETVREALPSASAPAASPSAPGTAEPGATTSGTPEPEPTGPVTVARGELISHEHETSGEVSLLRLADGSHVLRLSDLDTSNGPDLRVWLTDAPVKEGRAGWHVFDDGSYKELGRLKGNKGDQNYAVPADVDPAAFTSMSIWCDRFNVSFGAAELTRAEA